MRRSATTGIADAETAQSTLSASSAGDESPVTSQPASVENDGPLRTEGPKVTSNGRFKRAMSTGSSIASGGAFLLGLAMKSNSKRSSRIKDLESAEVPRKKSSLIALPSLARKRSTPVRRTSMLFEGDDARRKRRGSFVVSEKLKSTVNRSSYPMYAMKIATVLGLDRFEPHQLLLSQGKLEQWNATMAGRIIFVSHQWLGREVPDPKNVQLRVLQRMLRRLMAGEVAVVESWWEEKIQHPDEVTQVLAEEWVETLPDMYIWVDYCCMPQPSIVPADADPSEHQRVQDDLMSAVVSIPSYVERVAMVLVLAPTAVHENGQTCSYKSWRSRGWCRCEFISARLSRMEVRVMLVTGGENTPHFVFPSDVAFLPPGEGCFSCCAMGHRTKAGVPFACDKFKIRAVMDCMLQGKIDFLHSKGEKLVPRFFVGLRQWLLRGLPDLTEHDGSDQNLKQTSEVLLQAMRQSYANFVGNISLTREVVATSSAIERLKERLKWGGDDVEQRESGWSLFVCAVAANDIDALREFEGSAELANSVINTHKFALKWIAIPAKCSVLILAMSFADWPVVEVLLDMGADPYCRAGGKKHQVDAFLGACLMGRHDNVLNWLRRFPSWDLTNRTLTSFRNPPLHVAVRFGTNRSRIVQVLLDHGADPRLTNIIGANAIHEAVESRDADPMVVSLLLERGSTLGGQSMVHAHFHAQESSFWSFVFWLSRVLYRLGVAKQSVFLRQVADTSGLTPLHQAAYHGHSECCEVLLRHGADPIAKNTRGRTPLQLARERLGSEAGAIIKAVFMRSVQDRNLSLEVRRKLLAA